MCETSFNDIYSIQIILTSWPLKTEEAQKTYSQT